MNRIRLGLVFLLAAALLNLSVPIGPRTAAAVAASAEAAALIDVESGRILYSHNGNKPMRIASLTKIMTAIVAIEHGNLGDRVKTGINAYGVEGSSIYLKLGEEQSLLHLLYGLMLRSGNDAAVAIAEHVGGSVEGFVQLMNEKAEQLGLTGTTFKNPHGLDADGHLSTAEDVARLTAYALKHPVFREIVKTPSIRIPNPGETWDHLWRNKNKMLHLYPGADGVKTGYTKSAGRCLVSSATRDGRQLAAVTLNASNDWSDHARLLDYGFSQFAWTPLYRAGEPFGETGWYGSRSFYYPLAEGEQVIREVVPVAPDSLDGRLGVKAVVIFRLGGEEIGRLLLYEKHHPLAKTGLAEPDDRTAGASPGGLVRDGPFGMWKRLWRGLFTVPGAA
jgi:D-alanyl-D-alanine carboxypeptidase